MLAFTSRRGSRMAPEREERSLRLALAWLSFPPLLMTVSTGTTDVVLAVLLLAAVLAWRRPGAAAALITAGGWFKLAPFALLPLWLAPRRGRALVISLGGVVAVSLPLVALLVVLGGSAGIGEMLHGIAYHYTRGVHQSLWSLPGTGGWQPVAQGLTLGLVAGLVARLVAEPGLGAQPARIAAMAAAVTIALQLAASYWAFLYLAWIAPLLCMGLLDELAHTAPVVVRARTTHASVSDPIAPQGSPA